MSSGEDYDPGKALLRAGLAGGGAALGDAASRAVGNFGTNYLRDNGLQNRIIPNAIHHGVSASAYTLGEVGGDELGRAATEDNYTPDWNRIGNSAASAFAFATLDDLVQGLLVSKRDKARIQSDVADVKESFEAAMRAQRDPNATPEQRAQLAQQTIDRANWASRQMDEMGSFGARREIDRMQGVLGNIVEEMKPYTVGDNPFSLDSSGYSSHNTLNLGKQGSFGERMVGQIAENPQIFGMYDSPDSFKASLEGAGFEVKPLGKGALMNVPFESGGGFRVNFSDGGLLQYHPEEYSHHKGAYYKISTGKGGIHHYDINGNEIVP